MARGGNRWHRPTHSERRGFGGENDPKRANLYLGGVEFGGCRESWRPPSQIPPGVTVGTALSPSVCWHWAPPPPWNGDTSVPQFPHPAWGAACPPRPRGHLGPGQRCGGAVAAVTQPGAVTRGRGGTLRGHPPRWHRDPLPSLSPHRVPAAAPPPNFALAQEPLSTSFLPFLWLFLLGFFFQKNPRKAPNRRWAHQRAGGSPGRREGCWGWRGGVPASPQHPKLGCRR